MTDHRSDCDVYIQRALTYHKPDLSTVPIFEAIRATAREMARMIFDTVPDGEERHQALLSLEQTVMWANAGVARPPVQEENK